MKLGFVTKRPLNQFTEVEMTVKRSRIYRWLSEKEVDLLNEIKPIEWLISFWGFNCLFEKSSGTYREEIQSSINALKKKENLMYGFFGAFCSPDCREEWMSWDGFDKEDGKELNAAVKLTAKTSSLGRAWNSRQVKCSNEIHESLKDS